MGVTYIIGQLATLCKEMNVYFFFIIRSTTIHWSVNMLYILALEVLRKEREHYSQDFQDGEIFVNLIKIHYV